MKGRFMSVIPLSRERTKADALLQIWPCKVVTAMADDGAANMNGQQPLTSDDAERLCDQAIKSLGNAMSMAMLIQYILLGLILWRVW